MGDREAKMGRMFHQQAEGQRAATTSPTLGLKTGKNWSNLIEVVFLSCLIVKSLSPCVRVIQTSSLDVDFEDYAVFLLNK